jgi:hypothetical protein
MAEPVKQDNKDAEKSGQPVQLDKEPQSTDMPGREQHQGEQQKPGHEQQQTKPQPPAK